MNYQQYGIARNPDDWVTTTRSLTDAINQAREMGDDWLIMERTVTEWEEVSA